MAKLIFCNMWEIVNIKISYCFLVCIYLFIFSPNIKNYCEVRKWYNIKDVTVNTGMLLILNIVIFNINNIHLEVQIFLLMLCLVFYNKFVLLQNFKLAMLTTGLYWGLAAVPILTFSFFRITYSTDIVEFIIVCALKYLLAITFFVTILFRVIVPVVKNGMFLKICYPKNKFLLFLYWLLLTMLTSIPMYVCFLQNKCEQNSGMFFLLKSLCLLMVICLLFLIYLIIIKLQKYKIIEDLQEALIDDSLLTFSAAKEEKLIKNINAKARLYSCQAKAYILKNELEKITESNELYCSLKRDLQNFYIEYFTGDDVINNIFSEKYLICDWLNIKFLVNVAMVDINNVELEKLRYLYTILSTSIDIAIISINTLNSSNKSLKVNILNFGKFSSIEIIGSNKETNVEHPMFIKNKILNSNKYQYLYYMVKKFKGKIFLKVTTKGLQLIINCE